MKTFKPLGYYDYTVVLTYVGMMFSFYGIMMSIEGKFFEALFCLLLAGLCDMLDGTVASTKERSVQEKRFGVQIDSLCDLISFGMMPALFVYLITDCNPLVGILSALYTLAGLIRLAYFNVLEEERSQNHPEKKRGFVGIPITTIALLLPIACLLQSNVDRAGYEIIIASLILCGIGFLTPIDIKKPNATGKICLTIIGLLEAFCVFFVGRAII